MVPTLFPNHPDGLEASAKRTASPAKKSFPQTFLSLPCEIRNNIYRRVLVLAHPLFLFQDTGSRVVETFAPDKPARWLALLYVSRQVHTEASVVLYGSNHFTLVDTMPHEIHLLRTFLDRIGPKNASSLSHLSINFPAMESVQGQPGKIMPMEDGLNSLTLLREKCTNLTMLETLVHTPSSRGLVHAGHDELKFIREVLVPINTQLKTISSLSKIIVRFYNGLPTPSVIALMQGLGWDVCRGDGAKLDLQGTV